MGVNNLQGTSAYIEYLKRCSDGNRNVNCKFWKIGICYNEIALKYGSNCYSKRGCMYSIPINAGLESKRLY